MPNEEEEKKPQQPQEQPKIQPLHERSSWEELGKTVNREEIIRKWDVIDTSSTNISLPRDLIMIC